MALQDVPDHPSDDDGEEKKDWLSPAKAAARAAGKALGTSIRVEAGRRLIDWLIDHS